MATTTPLTPDMLIAQTNGAGQTPSPWFTIANQFMPRNLHDVIRWARYITVQSPTTTEVIRKLCTYPITEFIVDTNSDEVEKRYAELFESFKLKEKLQDIGFDYYTLAATSRSSSTMTSMSSCSSSPSRSSAAGRQHGSCR